jgi:hypothetical protein
MTERSPGPRDWEPSDPEGQWWNPRPGDPYGPSDQEHRQPWEPPAPVRRFPGGPAPGQPPAPGPPPAAGRRGTLPPAPVGPFRLHSSWYDLLRGLALLVVAVVAVGVGVAIFIGSWRTPALVAVAVALAVGVELAILGAAAAFRQAPPRPEWPGHSRKTLPAIVVVALALAPAGLAVVLRDQQWSPGVWLAVAGLVIALLIWMAAAARHPDPAPAMPNPEAKAPRAAAFAGLLGWAALLIGCGCMVVPAAVQQAFFNDPLADVGEPIVALAPIIPTPSWSPPATTGTDDPAARIRHDLESRVLRSAGTPGPVTSECPQAFERPEFVCTVTYRELTIEFSVETWPAVGNSYDHRAEAFETVLTRAGLHAQLSARYPEYRDLRCDELPETQLARVGEHLPQRCYGKPSRWAGTKVFAIIPAPPGEPPTFVLDPD